MASSTNSDYRIGLLLVNGAAIAWSTAGFFTRRISLDSWTILVWRGLFAALGLLIAVVLIEGWPGLRRFRAPGLLLVAISALGMVLFITALRHTTVAHVGVIYAAVPFVGAGMVWVVLREVPSRSAITASLVALVGVAVMVGLDRVAASGAI